MTEQDARELEIYWGAPGPRPAPAWRCCAWCGDWYGPEIRYWRNNHKRVCAACDHDWRTHGVRPRPAGWHQKHRWTVDGRLERACPHCPRSPAGARWRPLTAFYVCNMYAHDTTKRRTRTVYPYAFCIPCARRTKAARARRTPPHRRRPA